MISIQPDSDDALPMSSQNAHLFDDDVALGERDFL